MTSIVQTAFPQRSVRRLVAVAGFDMWVAVWQNRGRGAVMIGAPTLDDLEARWEQITNTDFDRTIAQRTVQIAWHGSDVPKPPEPEVVPDTQSDAFTSISAQEAK